MGGYMTWLVARSHPERFAAAVPCCSSGMNLEGEELEWVARLPFWAIHCEGDFIPLETVSGPMRSLMSRNLQSRFLILPEGFYFPNGTPTVHNHLVWIPLLNDLQFNDGTLYADRDGKLVDPR